MRGILLTLVSVTALVSAASVNTRCHKDPREAAAICRAAGSDGVLVAHERCDKFYKCSHRKPVPLLCPSNLLYNPELEYCDWPNYVDCGNRVIPQQDGNHNVPSVESDDDKDVFNNSGHEDPSQALNICARPGSDGALIAHEYCTKFYKCFQSHPVELKCPPSLHYNYNAQQCDWPQNVVCGSRLIPDEEDNAECGNGQGGASDDNSSSSCNCDPSEAPEICAKKDSDGVLVAHEKCNQFYKCAHGRPTVHKCPPKLLYNAYLQACDWPNNVDCGVRVQPEHNDTEDNGKPEDEHNDEGHSDPSQAPSICAEKDSDSVLVAHELCNKFYICLHGRPFPINCPHGLHFDPKSKKCDWPENVECRGRIIPNNTNNLTGVVEEKREVHSDPSKAPEICAEHESVLVAHEKCNRFYQCAGGRPVERKCAHGLVYNYNTEQCDWVSNVECGNRIIAEEEEEETKEPENVTEKEVAGHDDPSKAPTICAEEESDGVLVAHEQCNKFYICAAGAPVARLCPKGLLYNPRNERCDWVENTNCGDRIPPVDNNGDNDCDQDNDENNHNDHQGNYDPSKAPEICSKEDSDGVLIAHEYCSKFYICVNSHPLARVCPKGLLFNPRKNLCDWPQNVNCRGRVHPQEQNSSDDRVPTRRRRESAGYDYPSNAKIVCGNDESDGVLVAHEFCNKFYQCVNHVPVKMDCPRGLHFSAEEQHCEWPNNVVCGDRIIPEEKDDAEIGDSSEEKEHVSNNNDDPSKAPEICAEKDSDGIQVAHEYCNKFYKCVNHRPFPVQCPEDLYYNPKNERCDWQENVQCKDRIRL